MSKEVPPNIHKEAFLIGFERAFGSVGIISGTISAVYIIRNGPEYVIEAVEKVWRYDMFAWMMHHALEVGVPVQITVGAILATSSALLVDSLFRNREIYSYFKRNDR